MSRSYKKHPWCKGRPSKGMKRFANKRVRQALKNHDYSLPNSSFRKHTESWDLSDWRFYGSSFEDYYKECIKRWHQWRVYGIAKDKPTREEAYKDYIRSYRRK